MSAPSRRRNPTIKRGKKGERKRNKRQELQTDNVSPLNGLAAISEKAEKDRKARLINNGTTDADITLLSEPSGLFNTETDKIRNITTKTDTNLINIKAANFEFGIELKATITDRSRVIKGQKPKIFNRMPTELRKKKEEIKQSSRQIDANIIEKTRKRRELGKKNAAIAHENKLLDLKKKEAARLAQEKLEKEMQIEAARLAAAEREEVARLAQVELGKKMQIKKSIREKKDGFWVKIFNKLTSLIPKKREKLPKSRQRTEDLKATISEKEEAVIDEIEEEVLIEEEEIETVIDEIEDEVLIEEEEIETVIDEIEDEVLIEEEETETVIDEIEEEVLIEEEEAIIDEIEEEVLIEEEEVLIEEEEVLIEEEEAVIDEIEEEVLIEEEETVPTIESGEVILAELRIAMRTEPSPINYIINMLTNKHDLSIQNAKYIINHIVAPISICKMLTDEQFDDFIQSLDKNNSGISKGGEIWTQVIQIIGLSSLTMDARVDIYNILSDGKNQNKISKRVITIALLLNALPINFKQWWSMDIFLLEVIEHYGKANKFFRNKKFPQEAIDEARMLICSYAIEKPKSISAEYNYAKQISGNEHENRTEKWLKGSLRDVRYITEKQIQTYRDKHYGNKYINPKITPDILLEIPIQLSADSQPIHWIDAKNHFVDPALSSDENVQSICRQMNKYVRAYGPGLIVWGKNFSEEWNEATKGAVQHIKI